MLAGPLIESPCVLITTVKDPPRNHLVDSRGHWVCVPSSRTWEARSCQDYGGFAELICRWLQSQTQSNRSAVENKIFTLFFGAGGDLIDLTCSAKSALKTSTCWNTQTHACTAFVSPPPLTSICPTPPGGSQQLEEH